MKMYAETDVESSVPTQTVVLIICMPSACNVCKCVLVTFVAFLW